MTLKHFEVGLCAALGRVYVHVPIEWRRKEQPAVLRSAVVKGTAPTPTGGRTYSGSLLPTLCRGDPFATT